MNTETVNRIYRNMSGENTPQRGPRARDKRARDNRETRRFLDAYRHGYTDELDD